MTSLPASKLQLISIGNSVGVILPKELLAKLDIRKGDTLFVVETNGGIHLTTKDPDVDAQIEVARRVMKKRQSALRALAK